MLIPETGTGSSQANSYASVAQADDYFDLRGSQTWISYTTAEKEAALINATDFIEATYSESFKGYKSSATQALSWPRTDVVIDDYDFPSSAIPTRLIDATVQMALRSAGGEVLIQDQAQRVVKEKVDVIETTYAEFSDPQQRYPFVSRLLTPLLKSGGDGNFQSVRLVRT